MTRITHTPAPDQNMLDLIEYLAEEDRKLWPGISAGIPLWHPLNEGDDDDNDDDGDDSDTADDENDEDNDDDSNDSESDDGDDEKNIRVPRGEYERLRREEAQRKRKEKRDKQKRVQEERRKKAQAGQYEELLAEKDDEIEELNKKIEDLSTELIGTKSKGLISRVAKRLNFDDPDLADALFDRYMREGEDRTAEQDVESVLKRVLKDKPKLKAGGKATGGPTNGSTKGKITYEDIQNMSQDEISRRYAEPEFQAALEAGPST